MRYKADKKSALQNKSFLLLFFKKEGLSYSRSRQYRSVMKNGITPQLLRREATIGIAAASLLAVAAKSARAATPLAALEQRHGGRLGVFGLDTGTGRTLGQRADERFLMCSTFKAFLAACVLHRADTGQERLDRIVHYGKADLFDYAPVARAHLAEGGLTVKALCEAAVTLSDNTAATLLLKNIGGPPAFTRFMRALGDTTTRLDRTELALNTPSGVLDTTTPRAMALTLRTILLGPSLSETSRTMLENWMVASTTGLHRLREGVPKTWVAGDKTGTGHTETNDIAILRPPRRPPIFVAAFYEAPNGGGEGNEAMLREVGAIVAAWV